MASATDGCLGQRLGEFAAGVGGIDLLVDHTDLDRGVDPAGDAFMLLGQFLVQGLALVIGCRSELALMQDAHCRLGAHHGDLGIRPREYLRCAE